MLFGNEALSTLTLNPTEMQREKQLGGTEMLNSWMRLASLMAVLSWDAQQVVALRMLRIAQGGRRGHKEIGVMTAEKMKALVEAQIALVRVAPRSSQQAVKTILGVYRKRVRKTKGGFRAALSSG